MTQDLPPEIPEELKQYREEIDVLDIELIDVLARRFAVVRNVGHMKVRDNMDVVQPKRAQAVKDKAVEMGMQKGLSENFLRGLYDLLIDEAHEIEHVIVDDAKDAS